MRTFRLVAVLAAVTALTLSGCGRDKKSDDPASGSGDTTTTTSTSVTSTTLASTPAAAVVDAKAQLQAANSELSGATTDLSTAKKAIDDGEGEVQ